MLIIVGLILLLAGTGWFAAAGTVGWILLVAGLLFEALPLILVVVFVGSAFFASKASRRYYRRVGR